MYVNGNGGVRTVSYIVVAIVSAVAGAFMTFETRSDHQHDFEILVTGQAQIMNKLDRLAESPALQSPPRSESEPSNRRH